MAGPTKAGQAAVRIRPLAVALMLCLFLIPAVSAQQSELQQQILEPDCSIPENCEMQAPTLRAINKNGGRPILTGSYDAAFTKMLRVIFGNRVYTLDIDSELTARNGDWELDLRTLSVPLVSGEYELIIETRGYDDKVQQTYSTITFVPGDIVRNPDRPRSTPNKIMPGSDNDNTDDESGSEDDGIIPPEQPWERPQPMMPEKQNSYISPLPLLLALALGGIGCIGLLTFQRWRKR